MKQINSNSNHRLNNEHEDETLKLRNILNIIFMLGAIAGLVVYFFINHTIGTIIILAAMVFKIVESSIRLFH